MQFSSIISIFIVALILQQSYSISLPARDYIDAQLADDNDHLISVDAMVLDVSVHEEGINNDLQVPQDSKVFEKSPSSSESNDCSITEAPYLDKCYDCGKTYFQPNTESKTSTSDSKIVGGYDAVPNSWPAHAHVLLRYRGIYRFPNSDRIWGISVATVCGSTLINKKTVMTAAHCVATQFVFVSNGQPGFPPAGAWLLPIRPNVFYPTVESMFTVTLGAFDVTFIFTGTAPASPAVQMGLSKVIVHPSYNPVYALNDIAVFHLASPVTFNEYIQPACFPDPEYGTFPEVKPKPKRSVTASAIGWGRLSNGGSLSLKLQNVNINIYNETKCSNVATGAIKNWPSQICAGDVSGEKSVCNGDSGGGLYVYDSKTKKYVVTGVVSYGDIRGCAQKDLPAVFTRTSYFLKWIKANWDTGVVAGSN